MTLADRNVQPATAITYGYVARNFVRAAGITSAAEITMENLLAYIVRKGVSTRTQKDQRGRLYGFCRHLVKFKLLATNPVREIDPIRQTRKPVVYAKVETVEKTLEIFARWMPRGGRFDRYAMLPRFLLTGFSPLRPEEITRLNDDWSNFNLEEGTVQVVRTKDGSENVTVELDARLVVVLRDCARRNLQPNFRRRAVWTHWVAAGGVPSGVRDVLRHSYASHSYAVDRNKFELSHRMNNTVGILDRHYINSSVLKQDGELYFTLLDKVTHYMALPEMRYYKSGSAVVHEDPSPSSVKSDVIC